MRLIPDTLTTLADLVDYLKAFFPKEDADLLIRLMEEEFDRCTS